MGPFITVVVVSCHFFSSWLHSKPHINCIASVTRFNLLNNNLKALGLDKKVCQYAMTPCLVVHGTEIFLSIAWLNGLFIGEHLQWGLFDSDGDPETGCGIHGPTVGKYYQYQ